jgi:hypothetical protein
MMAHRMARGITGSRACVDPIIGPPCSFVAGPVQHPALMLFGSIEKSDQGSRIDDGGLHIGIEKAISLAHGLPGGQI